MPVATIDNFADARDTVFGFVGHMLENLPTVIAATDSGPQHIRTSRNLLPPSSLAPRRSSSSMPHTPMHTDHAMVLDDPLPVAEPGEICRGGMVHSAQPARRNNQGRRSWGKDQVNSLPGQASSADASCTFMQFFRAEAQAKELAVKKAAHVFKRMVRAEHERRHPPGPSTIARVITGPWTIVFTIVVTPLLPDSLPRPPLLLL
ncbi:hypothetical protein AZE42_10316 [Rhizopogon vesiculosus]|uniref:Uncharacterized protein n=1 Tax=Rhizopogon vesiculosus TaxID=180088 RepID=A0A1J8PZT1_9AGAM|nr:hypothetical protein AZE42_10316 [Rhizopogon vesiculosus]